MKNKQLVSQRERIYFTLCVISNMVGFIYLFAGVKWYWGVLIALGLGFVRFFSHGLSMAAIRMNGIRLTERQFPEVYGRLVEIAQRMGLKKMPTVFLTQSHGVLNAFAARFARKNYVVLLSGVFELAKENPLHLDFIIAHELSHIQRKHTAKHSWIGFANLIPFLTHAYSRACEYTCDRMACAFTGSKEAAIEGLLILGAGTRLYKDVNVEEYLTESKSEGGFFVWLANILSTHPPLPKRIQAIEQFAATGEFTVTIQRPSVLNH